MAGKRTAVRINAQELRAEMAKTQAKAISPELVHVTIDPERYLEASLVSLNEPERDAGDVVMAAFAAGVAKGIVDVLAQVVPIERNAREALTRQNVNQRVARIREECERAAEGFRCPLRPEA